MCSIVRKVTAKVEGNGRKRYFKIDENVSSEEIYALLNNFYSADELDIGDSMNDFNTEHIAEEEIQPEKGRRIRQ